MSSAIKLLVFTSSESNYNDILSVLQSGHIAVDAKGVYLPEDFERELSDFRATTVVAESENRELLVSLLRKARLVDPDLPFVVLSPIDEATPAVELLKAGADDYILKSNIRQLPAAVSYQSDQYNYRLADRQVLSESKHADETLRLIHEHMEDIVFLLDDKSRLTYTSPSFQNLLSKKTLDRNYDVFKNIHPGDRGNVMEVYHKIWQDPQSRRVEFRFQPEPEITKYLESHWNAIEDDKGKIRYVMVVARVVTKRKKAEEALRENVKHFRALLENISDAISLINPYGIVLFTSRSTHRVLGYHAQEFVGLNFFDIIHPDDRIPVISEMNLLREKPSKLLSLRFRCKHHDGSWRWMDGVANNLLNDPVVKAIVFNYRDVTQKKASEDALRRSEERFRAMIEHGYDSIWLLSDDASITYVGPSSEVITGFLQEQTVGQPVWAFVHPDDVVNVKEKFKRLIRRAEQVEIIDFRLLRKDGTYRWVEGVANNLLLQPTLEAIVFNFRDVTERKVAAEAVSAERERLRVTLRSIADGVIATDTVGRVVLMNASAEKILAVSVDDAVGKPIASILKISTADGTFRQPIAEVLETRRPIEVNQWILERDGEKRTLFAQASPIQNQDGHLVGVVLVLRDITDQIKTENELLRTKKIESIGILAGGIAHDFNNILSAILGNISIAKLKVEHGNREKSLELLGRAEKASERARDLTQQLLTFSKGGAPVKKTSNIGELLRDSAAFSVAGSNVRCTFDLPADLFQVNIDGGQISQVINNLIINARHAMPSGGTVTITAKNMVLEHRQTADLAAGNYVQISVTDQGVGISEENLPRIFDPYFTTKKTGSGLGLATSYSIIRNHQGSITVTSQVGKGTTFIIYLPAEKQTASAVDNALVSSFVGHGKVLLVDDEESIREMASTMLQSLGFEVVGAADGQEGLMLYEEHQKRKSGFDLVILDLTIPGGMGGLETVEKLRKKDPYARVIVSSGYSNDPVMAEFSKYGFVEVLTKPYKTEELVRVLGSLQVAK